MTPRAHLKSISDATRGSSMCSDCSSPVASGCKPVDLLLITLLSRAAYLLHSMLVKNSFNEPQASDVSFRPLLALYGRRVVELFLLEE